MKKSLFAVFACVVLALALTACGGSSGVKPITPDKSGNVVGNGGEIVATGDYVYFINGINSSTTYKTGAVVKGALMRVKKNDLLDLKNAAYETVVSKILVSSDTDAGFYIYGDNVYYAAPTEDKDKTGSVKTGVIDFFRTSLDGKSTSSDITAKAKDKSGSSIEFTSSAEYRFINAGKKVYLVVYSNGVYVFDTDSNKQVFSSETVTSSVDEVLFGEGSDNGDAVAAFFSYKPINENLYDKDSDSAQQVAYNEVYRITVGADVKAEKVIDGIGSAETGNTAGGSGFTGATVDLIKYNQGTLYFSYTSLDDSSDITYKAIDNADLSESNAKAALTESKGVILAQKSVDGISSSSIYYGKDSILYTGSNGLMKYDYNKKDDYETSDYGETVIYSDDTVKSATLDYTVKEGDNVYLYYHDSSNYYYKLNLTKVLKGEETESFRINTMAMTSSWYSPEVVEVSGKYVFVGVYDDLDYYSYNYAINTTELEEKYEALKAEKNAETDESKKAEIQEKIDDFYAEETWTQNEAKEYYSTHLLGVMTDADKTSYEKYIATLSEEE